MSDYRTQLINSIEQSLVGVLDPETNETVTRKILCILNDYEVTKRCTEVAIYDDTNDRLLKRYCACLMVEDKAEKTVYGYRRHLQRFMDFIGRPVTEINGYDVRYYLASEKERGLAKTSLENTRSCISSFFEWMTNEEIIAKNPCATLKPIKVQNKEKFPFSTVEIDALRNSCMTRKERMIVEVLLSSGMRVDELSKMDVCDVNLESLSVHIKHGKGSKERITYLSEVAKVHFQMYLAERTDKNTAFVINYRYKRMTSGGVRYLLGELAKRANVSNVHPHRFRRTFATSLAEKGMPIQEIQKLLGHSNISTTLRYIHVNNESIKAHHRQLIA